MGDGGIDTVTAARSGSAGVAAGIIVLQQPALGHPFTLIQVGTPAAETCRGVGTPDRVVRVGRQTYVGVATRSGVAPWGTCTAPLGIEPSPQRCGITGTHPPFPAMVLVAAGGVTCLECVLERLRLLPAQMRNAQFLFPDVAAAHPLQLAHPLRALIAGAVNPRPRAGAPYRPQHPCGLVGPSVLVGTSVAGRCERIALTRHTVHTTRV